MSAPRELAGHDPEASPSERESAAWDGEPIDAGSSDTKWTEPVFVEPTAMDGLAEERSRTGGLPDKARVGAPIGASGHASEREPEHASALARIARLEKAIDAEREAAASEIAGVQSTLAAERKSAVARIARLREIAAGEIAEVQSTLAAERESVLARIARLEETLGAEREAAAGEVAGLHGTLAAEREAALARIA